MDIQELELILLLRQARNDSEIWKLLLDFAGEDAYTVYLDNDDTAISVDSEDEDEESFRRKLDNFIGNSNGVCALLTTLKIKWERY